jgi:hypothetical protein
MGGGSSVVAPILLQQAAEQAEKAEEALTSVLDGIGRTSKKQFLESLSVLEEQGLYYFSDEDSKRAVLRALQFLKENSSVLSMATYRFIQQLILI